jgi:adhesin/invasin
MHSHTALRDRLAAHPVTVLTGIIFTAAAAACSSTPNQVPTSMAIVSGNGQTATVASAVGAPMVVQIKDQNGNPLSGVHVSFNANGGATVSNVLTTTDASGNASTSMVLGTVSGLDTVTVVADSVVNPLYFTVTANPGPAAALVLVSGGNQTASAGTALTNGLVVQVTDQYGNPVPGATIDWTASAGTVTTTAQSTSAPNGTFGAVLQLPANAGTVTVTATIDGTSITAVFTETGD